jgi:hypothetical protein
VCKGWEGVDVFHETRDDYEQRNASYILRAASVTNLHKKRLRGSKIVHCSILQATVPGLKAKQNIIMTDRTVYGPNDYNRNPQQGV